MAVRDFASAKKSSKKFRPTKTKIFVFCCIVAFFSIIVFGCILPNYAKAAEYKQEAAQLLENKADLDEESTQILDSLDHKDELFEKIAREEYGYCKPGEKVLYNSSFGE